MTTQCENFEEIPTWKRVAYASIALLYLGITRVIIPALVVLALIGVVRYAGQAYEVVP